MVEIKLESNEQVVDKVVNHYGNITGMKTFEGKKVKVIVLGELARQSNDGETM